MPAWERHAGRHHADRANCHRLRHCPSNPCRRYYEQNDNCALVPSVRSVRSVPRRRLTIASCCCLTTQCLAHLSRQAEFTANFTMEDIDRIPRRLCPASRPMTDKFHEDASAGNIGHPASSHRLKPAAL